MKLVSKTLSLALLSVLTLATTGVSKAASIYVPASQNNGYTNYYAPGLYYYGGATPNTQTIGVVTGNAYVEASWGSNWMHYPGGTTSFNGTPAVAINQLYLWNQTTPGTGSWSGFGGPGAGTYNLTGSSTLVAHDASSVSMTRVSALTGTIVTVASQAALNPAWFTGTSGNVGVNSPGGSGYQYSVDQYFSYAPGLTGAYSLEVSWGIGASSQPLANWWLDVNGTGNPVNYVSLLSNVNTNLFSDGVDRTTGVNGPASKGLGQWSGFMDAGNVTLNSNSRIVYQSQNTGVYGTVSDLQFTVVPEPRAALLGGMGLLALLRRRRNR